jgi:uncharacterized RDD family membrane protein YckC
MAAAISGLLAAAACAAGEPMMAASSDNHLWFVVQLAQPGRPIVLRHHALEMEGPYHSKGLPLARFPVAMAAWGNQLWIVFPPKRGQVPLRRETFTVQVDHNPAFGGYYHTPHDHLRVVESLEGLGKLVGFVGAAGGPVALLVPSQRAGAGVQAGADSIAAEPVLPEPQLLQLRGRAWTPLPLPEGFVPGRSARLGAGGEQGQVLVVLSDAPGDRNRSTVHWRNSGGTWTRSDVPLVLPKVHSLTRVGASVTLVGAGPTADRLQVAYLRPQRLLPLPDFAAPSGRWAVLGLRDGMRLIEQSARGELALRRIDPRRGHVGPPQPLTSQPLMTGRLLHMPLLFAGAITALVVVFLFKPSPKAAPVNLPAALTVLPPVPRLIAVTADLAVGGLVTSILLQCTPVELLRFPLWTADLTRATPALVMIAITVVHSTLGELFGARTLGKALVGARVVSGDGSRPPPVAILARNGLKALVLLIPLLAVFALLNPHAQGLGDLVARTVVVRSAADESASPPHDR